MLMLLRPVRAEQQSHCWSDVAAIETLNLGCYARCQPACNSRWPSSVLADDVFPAVGQYAAPRCCHTCTCSCWLALPPVKVCRLHAVPAHSTVLPHLRLQFSSLKALIGDLRGGLARVNTEILEAAGCGEDSASAHKQFGELMVAFHQTAKQTFLSLEVSLALSMHKFM